jgi:hypothetical protein
MCVDKECEWIGHRQASTAQRRTYLGGHRLGRGPRRRQRPADLVARGWVDEAERAPERHHALLPPGQGTAHGDVAELLFLHGQDFGAQMLEPQLHPALALVERHGRARDQGRLLEEDAPPLPVRGGAHGHGVHERRLLGRGRLIVGIVVGVCMHVLREERCTYTDT